MKQRVDSTSSAATPVSDSQPASTESSKPVTSGTIEKKAPVVGENRRHLASRQGMMSVPMDQALQQQKALQALVENHQALQTAVEHSKRQQAHLVDMALSMHTSLGKGDTADHAVGNLFTGVENLILDNKSLQNQVSKLESDLKSTVEKNETLESVANELRDRCVRLERKYNDEKAKCQVLEAEKLKRESHL